jgi:negative regulator of sigma E activity
VNQDEVESQLSAMLDGELPAAECELLSRRIDRDENLRTRWSRYALIGAAMRFEPVATARSNFAARVSSALEQAEGKARPAAAAAGLAVASGTGRARHLWWQAALAATLVGAVAGLSITMLRNVTLDGGVNAAQSARNVVDVPVGQAAAGRTAGTALLPAAPADLQRQAQVLAGGTLPASAASAVAGPPAGVPAGSSAHEPWSYVTPPDDGGANTPLRTELVDYIVAHSEYSTPLMRPDLLSELISGEDGVDSASSVAGADSAPGAGAPVNAGANGIDATPSSASASGR